MVCDVNQSLYSLTGTTMLTNPNPFLSKAEWCRYCIDRTNLNLTHFKIVEAVGLKVIASRSPLVASVPYKSSFKSTDRLRSYCGADTQTETGDVTLLFIFGKQPKNLGFFLEEPLSRRTVPRAVIKGSDLGLFYVR
jgi:hypothetical protein